MISKSDFGMHDYLLHHTLLSSSICCLAPTIYLETNFYVAFTFGNDQSFLVKECSLYEGNISIPVNQEDRLALRSVDTGI